MLLLDFFYFFFGLDYVKKLGKLLLCFSGILVLIEWILKIIYFTVRSDFLSQLSKDCCLKHFMCVFLSEIYVFVFHMIMWRTTYYHVDNHTSIVIKGLRLTKVPKIFKASLREVSLIIKPKRFLTAFWWFYVTTYDKKKLISCYISLENI